MICFGDRVIICIILGCDDLPINERGSGRTDDIANRFRLKMHIPDFRQSKQIHSSVRLRMTIVNNDRVTQKTEGHFFSMDDLYVESIVQSFDYITHLIIHIVESRLVLRNSFFTAIQPVAMPAFIDPSGFFRVSYPGNSAVVIGFSRDKCLS